MAASKPVVATDIPGYASVVSKEVDGLLVAPKDIKALAGSLDLLIKDAALRRSLGEKGRQKAEEHSWDKVSSRVMDYYEWVIDQSRRRVGR